MAPYKFLGLVFNHFIMYIHLNNQNFPTTTAFALHMSNSVSIYLVIVVVVFKTLNNIFNFFFIAHAFIIM